MKIFKVLFHFLGGIRLAITLLALAGITAITGTILESKYQSHLLAAKWTYEHPAFFLLLSLFFINILFAALRRWPFQKRHIPFLITHLGLLMVISGTIIKNRWGVQGQMTLLEGSGSQHLLIPHTYSVLFETQEEAPHRTKDNTPSLFHQIELPHFKPSLYFPSFNTSLKCKLIAFVPHAEEKIETWIKSEYASIAGFPKISLSQWEIPKEFPNASLYFSKEITPSTWSILALRTSYTQEAATKAYLQGITLLIKPKDKNKETLEIALENALQISQPFMDGRIESYLVIENLNEKTPVLKLQFTWFRDKTNRNEKFDLSINGQDALIVKNTSFPWNEPPFTIDLKRDHPGIFLTEDKTGKIAFMAFDTAGRFHLEHFQSAKLNSLLSYDFGFSGYAVQANVPFPNFSATREDKERADRHAMKKLFQEALEKNPPLTPPIRFLKEACHQASLDFQNFFFQFLAEWKASPGFLCNAEHPLSESTRKIVAQIDWQKLSVQNFQAIKWTVQLLDQLEESWNWGDDPIDVLEKHHWPFAQDLRQKKTLDPNFPLLNLIAKQMASLVEYLPPLDSKQTPTVLESAKLLSAYFRIYGIDPRALSAHKEKGHEQFDDLQTYWKEMGHPEILQPFTVFETPLTHSIHPKPLPKKPEDERPGIVLEIQEGNEKQTVALSYQAINGGLKWPILRGKYKIRFQPKLQELPYRIRLRQAREIFYPQSSQVYSYECDLLISGSKKEREEQILSMNRVFETWDGYRFYLGGISDAADFGIKRIQLAINYDPAKYALTYPGALLVFLGIVLLFWFSSKRSTQNKK